MLSPELIETKNDILKKVKLFKMKKAQMPEVIRKNRERILVSRLKEETAQAAVILAQELGGSGEEATSLAVKSQKSATGHVEQIMRKRHEKQFKNYFNQLVTDHETSKKSQANEKRE